MRNVRIFGINGVTVRDTDPGTNSRATTFQLLVHESQMDALNLATALGELRCTLRGTVENQNTDETTDTGEAFISWIRGTDTRVANSTGSTGGDIFGGPSTLALEPQVEEKKKELLIITPNGVTKYQWSRDDELPQKVDAPGDNTAGAAPITAANLLSGLGGYTPQYPTTQYPTTPGGAPAAVPPPASEATGVPEKDVKAPTGESSTNVKGGTKQPPKTGL